MTISESNSAASSDDCSTFAAARLLGMAVRSVQLMVDRGELEAWKTPGGHRRISRASLDAVLERRARAPGAGGGAPAGQAPPATRGTGPRVLLIEDSAHFQNLIGLLMRQALPEAELHIADDGIAGLALAGKLDPDILIVDILLPGIDGATLITSLRSHPQFRHMALIVVTSLDAQQREPYAFALQGVPVVQKTRLVAELTPLLQQAAGRSSPVGADPAAG